MSSKINQFSTAPKDMTEAMRLAQWRKTHRKGEVPPNWDDKRTKTQKHIDKKKNWKERFTFNFLKSERRQVIEAKIKHFEATGNQRKLAIYRSKL